MSNAISGAQHEVNSLLRIAARWFARFRFVLWEQNRVGRRTNWWRITPDERSEIWGGVRMVPDVVEPVITALVAGAHSRAPLGSSALLA